MPSHILVVEDERDLARVLTYNLKQAGFDVVSAPDGETALRAVREERFDLVLLDLMLPDMPGTEVCKKLKANAATSAIPVVMVTAKGEEVDRIVGFELGADTSAVKAKEREVPRAVRVCAEDLVEAARLRPDLLVFRAAIPVLAAAGAELVRCAPRPLSALFAASLGGGSVEEERSVPRSAGDAHFQ